jgi:hypothetical protein
MDKMSRTPDDLRQMAQECRRLASTCDTPEAERALRGTAREMDLEAGQNEVHDRLPGAREEDERVLSENPDRGNADAVSGSVSQPSSPLVHPNVIPGLIT